MSIWMARAGIIAGDEDSMERGRTLTPTKPRPGIRWQGVL